jgi:hypothetical protein
VKRAAGNVLIIYLEVDRTREMHRRKLLPRNFEFIRMHCLVLGCFSFDDLIGRNM